MRANEFSKNSDLGFTKDNIVMLPVPVNDSIGKLKMQLLKNELREIPDVQQISFCMEAPAHNIFDTKDLLVMITGQKRNHGR